MLAAVPMSMPSTALPGSTCMQMSNLEYEEAPCSAKITSTMPASNHLLVAKGSACLETSKLEAQEAACPVNPARTSRRPPATICSTRRSMRSNSCMRGRSRKKHLRETSNLPACIPESLWACRKNKLRASA